MNGRIAARLAGGAVILAAIGLGGPAAAETVGEFYKGKTITAVIGGSVGGGYDFYTRALTHHMGKYIPGNPNMIMQFMPGAGGTKAANYLYNAAPKDGTAIGLISNAAPMFQVLGGSGVKYDAAKFNWIGRAASMHYALMVWANSGVKSLDDLKTRVVVFGSTGRSQSNYMVPILLKNLLGLKARVITGYPGTTDIDLAMQKGELHGRLGTWSSWLIAAGGDWVKTRKVIPILQSGLDDMPELKEAPLLTSLAKNAEQKAVFELIASDAAVGRAFLLPPDVPKDRVAALRAAFDKTMKDDGFLADAKKMNLIIEPMSGVRVQEIVERAVATPAPLVAKTREALEWK